MTTINIPQTTEIENVQNSLVETLNLKVTQWGGYIKDRPAYEDAGVILTGIKGLQKQVVETFKESKELAHKLHKTITAQEKKHLDPLEHAETKLKGMMGCYVTEQRQLFEAQQRKEREAAEISAKIAADAELKRMEAERLSQAVAMEGLGFKAEAEAIISTPVTAPNIVAKVDDTISSSILADTKTDNINYRVDYTFEISDAAIVPSEYKVIDEKKLGRVVKALGKECKIPGVRVVEKMVIIGRSK
jgi:macrodomain Ter protein organizer (MatP/YcbG family)